MNNDQFNFLMSIDIKQQIEMLRYRLSIAEIIAMPEDIRIFAVIYEIKKGA